MGRSNSRTILVNLYLVPCFHNIYISLKFIIHSIYVVPICTIMYFKLSYLEEIKYIYLSIYLSIDLIRTVAFCILKGVVW